jgi:RNA polymerase sigma-70 factor, ECF subfamily
MDCVSDHAWFENEVAKTADDLRAFIAGLGAGAYLDEVLQDAFVALWRQGPPADGRTLPWLKGVAKHKLVDALRARSADARRLELVEVLGADPTVEDDDDRLRTEAMRHCLGRLPEKLRDLVQAFYREARTSDVIARTLGVSAVAVRKQLMRVRRMLSECVRQHLATRP